MVGGDRRCDVNTDAVPETRADGRADDELRPVSFTLDVAPASAGSVLVALGRTRVICAVSLENAVPRWMRMQQVAGGWLTAEYAMLPYATEARTSRASSLGRIGGRAHEIQRMIGRALRAVTDLAALGPRTLWVDCDVLEADGGTRTAAVTGAWVALRLATRRLLRDGTLGSDPVRGAVAAVSVGRVGGRARLDLCYAEDASAEVDLNVAMTDTGNLIEVQGAAERAAFSRTELEAMLDLAERGVARLTAAQARALADAS